MLCALVHEQAEQAMVGTEGKKGSIADCGGVPNHLKAV